MITKQKYLKAVHNEFRIIRHLFEKIPAGAHDYRPSEKQRTTLELLSYLTAIGSSTMSALLNGSFPEDFASRMQSVTMDNFLEKLEEEENKMKDLFSKFTEEDFETEIDLFGMGHPESKADYLLDIIQFLTAYKLQLFLYVKANGITDIGTSNAWMGMDMAQ